MAGKEKVFINNNNNSSERESFKRKEVKDINVFISEKDLRGDDGEWSTSVAMFRKWKPTSTNFMEMS